MRIQNWSWRLKFYMSNTPKNDACTSSTQNIKFFHHQKYVGLCGFILHQTPPFRSEMTKNRWRLGLCPRPRWGSLQRSPRPPSWFWGGEGWGGVEREGEGGEGWGKGWGGEGKEGREKRGGDKRASRHYFFYTLSTVLMSTTNLPHFWSYYTTNSFY